MGLLGGIVGGIGSIVGGIITGNKNESIASDNRDWQENMSNTSIQRRVEDMRAAGINPILSVANASSGASTPAGSTATIQNPVPSDLGDILSNSAKRKLEGDLLEQQATLYELNKKKLETDIKKQEMDAAVSESTTAVNSAKAIEIAENTKNLVENRQYIRAQVFAVTDALKTNEVNREWVRAKTASERYEIINKALTSKQIDAQTRKTILESENMKQLIKQNSLKTEGLELEINSMLNRGEFGQHTNWLFGNVGGIVNRMIK